MMEDVLINYGVLGAWTLSLLAERFTFQKSMKDIIKTNTQALNEIKDTINKCRRK